MTHMTIEALLHPHLHSAAWPPLYSLDDAAHVLGVTPKALRLMLWRGTLSAVKRSPRRFAGITRAELERYLNAVNDRGQA